MLRSIIAVCVTLCGSPLLAAEVNLYAASSLTDALKEIGTTYEAESGNRVVYNFAASDVLARQIEEGAPADIFFSADDAQMDRVEKGAHLEANSRRDLLSNTLVVVAPTESRLAFETAADLRKVTRIAVGDPKFVPVGVYTRAFLEKAGLWSELENKIIPTENVRAGLAVVESGNAEVGFVYATDAGISKKVKVVFRVPPEDTAPIKYPIALLKPHQRQAEQFFTYLTSEAARRVFEKFGFSVAR